jgi:hypothetical protein
MEIPSGCDYKPAHHGAEAMPQESTSKIRVEPPVVSQMNRRREPIRFPLQENGFPKPR